MPDLPDQEAREAVPLIIARAATADSTEAREGASTGGIECAPWK
jgi:hypothetical protein